MFHILHLLAYTGQTVQNFEILRARYEVHFWILPTGAHFQLKIPKYLSSRIFFSFSKKASHFFEKNRSGNFFWKTKKNHLRIPIHLHFWQKGFFKNPIFQKTLFNEKISKIFKIVWKIFFGQKTKWWIHTNLQDFVSSVGKAHRLRNKNSKNSYFSLFWFFQGFWK